MWLKLDVPTDTCPHLNLTVNGKCESCWETVYFRPSPAAAELMKIATHFKFRLEGDVESGVSMWNSHTGERLRILNNGEFQYKRKRLTTYGQRPEQLLLILTLFDRVTSGSPVIEYMKQNGIPLTRENYLRLNYLGNPPKELPAELEAELPHELDEEGEEGEN